MVLAAIHFLTAGRKSAVRNQDVGEAVGDCVADEDAHTASDSFPECGCPGTL